MNTSPYLAEIVDSIPAAVVVLDAHGAIALVNAHAETLFGYAHGELLGEPAEILIPRRFRTSRSEHLVGFVVDPSTRPMTAGQDLGGLRKDGTEFPVEIRMNSVATKDGSFIVSVIADVTERLQVDAKPGGKTEQLKLFVARAPVAMAMLDREMRYIVTSRRWLSDHGLGHRDLRGLSHYDVFPDLPDRWRTVHRRVLGGELVTATEDRFDRADGTVQWLRWEVQPWYDETSQGGIIIFTEDITDRKRAETLFPATVEAAPVGMVMSDSTGSIVLVNAEAERLFGYSRSDLLSRKVDMLVPDRFRATHPERRMQFFSAPKARPMGGGRHLFGLRKDGSEFPVEIGLSPVKTDVAGVFTLSAVVDITNREQLVAAKAKAEELATHDFLTGLPNRVLLMDRVRQALAMAKRNHQMVALLSLDIDDFKNVNDTYGHGIGDRLLVETAVRLKKSLRASDTVTRLGGDEFLLLAPEIASVTHAEGIAAHILEIVRHPFQLGELTLSTTFSLGVSLYPRDGTTPEMLIADSDRGLYAAKALGKNRFAFANHEERSN